MKRTKGLYIVINIKVSAINYKFTKILYKRLYNF